jgi:hypothetical protein
MIHLYSHDGHDGYLQPIEFVQTSRTLKCTSYTLLLRPLGISPICIYSNGLMIEDRENPAAYILLLYFRASSRHLRCSLSIRTYSILRWRRGQSPHTTLNTLGTSLRSQVSSFAEDIAARLGAGRRRIQSVVILQIYSMQTTSPASYYQFTFGGRQSGKLQIRG